MGESAGPAQDSRDLTSIRGGTPCRGGQSYISVHVDKLKISMV